MPATSDLASVMRGIYERNARTLTPALVVEASRPVDAPLHDRFEWDDAKAGESWRLHQAGELIRSVPVEYAENEDGTRRKARQWLPVSRNTDAGPVRVYEPTETILADPFQRQLVLRRFEREWRQFKARYEHLAEFAELVTRGLDDAA